MTHNEISIKEVLNYADNAAIFTMADMVRLTNQVALSTSNNDIITVAKHSLHANMMLILEETEKQFHNAVNYEQARLIALKYAAILEYSKIDESENLEVEIDYSVLTLANLNQALECFSATE